MTSRLRRLFFSLIVPGLAGAALIVRPMGLEADEPQPRASAANDRPAAAPGSLVICGGGRIPDTVMGQFMELAGGSRARIVLIPTAATDQGIRFVADNLDRWRVRGPASVEVLHTRSRTQADDPEFVRPLVQATGVWLGGGDQARLSDSYVDTEVERQLKALLDRGGVIGGTSAGAAIMTRVMINGGRTEAIKGRGFDLLPGSVVDQHFLKRNRLGRLLGLLAEQPDLVGFGIDEGTALVFRGERLSVVGDSYVVACMPAAPDRSNRLEILKPGDEFHPPWVQPARSNGKSAAALAPSAQTAARAAPRAGQPDGEIKEKAESR